MGNRPSPLLYEKDKKTSVKESSSRPSITTKWFLLDHSQSTLYQLQIRNSLAQLPFTSIMARRAPTQSRPLLERPLPRAPKKISLSAFSFLFSEIVQYSQSRVSQVAQLERRLFDLGFPIGQKLLELYSHRQRRAKRIREIKIEGLLSNFVGSILWPTLFGKAHGSIERSKDTPNRYHIYDQQPVEERFISQMPKMQINCSFFTAGILNGVLHAADFNASVKVFLTQDRTYTVYVIDVRQPARVSTEQLPPN